MPIDHNYSDAANRLFAMSKGEMAKTSLICINSNLRVTFHPSATFFDDSGDPYPKLVYFATGGAASRLITNISPPSPGLEPIICSSANITCQLPPAYIAEDHAHQFVLVSAYYNAAFHKQALTRLARGAMAQFPTSRTASLSTETAPDILMFFATGDAAGRLISLIKPPRPSLMGIRPLICTSADYACLFPAAFHAADAAHQFLFLSITHDAAGHLLALSDWMDRPHGPTAPLTVDRAHGSGASSMVDPAAFSTMNRALIPRPRPGTIIDLARIPRAGSTMDRAHIPHVSSTVDRAHIPRGSSTVDRAHIPRGSSTVDRARGSPTPLPRNRERASSTLSMNDRARVLRASATRAPATSLLASSTIDRAREPSADTTIDHAGESPADSTTHGSREAPAPPFTHIDAANVLVQLSRSDAAAGARLALSKSGSSNPNVTDSDSNDEEMETD